MAGEYYDYGYPALDSNAVWNAVLGATTGNSSNMYFPVPPVRLITCPTCDGRGNIPLPPDIRLMFYPEEIYITRED